MRLGIIGTGARGLSQLRVALYRSDIEVTAICDIDNEVLGKAQNMITKAGRAKVAEYGVNDMDYENLLKRREH